MEKRKSYLSQKVVRSVKGESIHVTLKYGFRKQHDA